MKMTIHKKNSPENSDAKKLVKNSNTIHKAISKAVNDLNKSSNEIPQHLFSALGEYTNGYFICFIDQDRKLVTKFEGHTDADAVALISHTQRFGNFMATMQDEIFANNMGAHSEDDEMPPEEQPH